MDISRDGITVGISRDGITVDISRDGITEDTSRDGITEDTSRDGITVDREKPEIAHNVPSVSVKKLSTLVFGLPDMSPYAVDARINPVLEAIPRLL